MTTTMMMTMIIIMYFSMMKMLIEDITAMVIEILLQELCSQ